MGGRERNKTQGQEANAGRGTVGKTAVVGAKDRKTNKIKAKVVENTDAKTLQKFVVETAANGATVYTDDAAAYKGMPFDHASVRHSVGEYVDGMGPTPMASSRSGACSSARTRASITRSAPSICNAMWNEFAGRHGVREQATLDQMQSVVAGMVGKRLMYRELVAD